LKNTKNKNELLFVVILIFLSLQLLINRLKIFKNGNIALFLENRKIEL
jgi:hypothetical protein